MGGQGLAKLPRSAWKLLLAGLALCEALSFWTGHPYDFEVWVRTAYVVAHGSNPYSGYWPPVPGLSFGYLNENLPGAAYLPFWPILLGGLYKAWEAIGFGNRFVLYFLLKQPEVLANALVAYLLYQIVFGWTQRPGPATRALAAWSFFPYTIIVTAVWGQFDVIVVVLVLLVFFVQTSLARSTLYGVGIFIKYVTAIFLPLELFVSRGFRRAYVLLGLAIPVVATVLATSAMGWSVHSLLAGASSQTAGGGGGANWAAILGQPFVASAIAAAPWLTAALSYLWVPAVVLAGYVGARWFATFTPMGMTRALLLVTSAFLLTRYGLEEQYLLYLFPLIILDVVALCPGRLILGGYTFVLTFAYLVVNNDFLIRFLTPLNPAIGVFTNQLDVSPIYGPVRSWTLFALSILITIALAQCVVTYLRDERRPVPWLMFWKRFRPPVESAPEPAPI